MEKKKAWAQPVMAGGDGMPILHLPNIFSILWRHLYRPTPQGIIRWKNFLAVSLADLENFLKNLNTFAP
jgi:hypothetical protein